MNRIYLDNAATSYPKAPMVGEKILEYINNEPLSSNRSTSSLYEVEEMIYETRELLCEIFNFNKPENVIFTKNVTESLNVILKGLLKRGDHILISNLEHNAVMRPLNTLIEGGIEVSQFTCNIEGDISLEEIQSLIKKNTKAIVCTHASNICGTVLPIKEIGKIAKEHNLFFIVDCAQSAGVLQVDMKKYNIDGLAFTGHKGLMGPQGIGGFILTDRLVQVLETFIEGGTGSFSEDLDQPKHMPDKFESGTMNLPGIIGLNTSINYIKNIGLDSIKNKENELLDYFLKNLGEKMQKYNEVRAFYGKINNRMAVVSLDFINKDNAEISYSLCKDYNIITRCGLHCAPAAHRFLGTYPQGTVRFSFGHKNTFEEIDYVINAIGEILNKD